MKIQGALINRAARVFMNSVALDSVPVSIEELSTVNNLLDKNKDLKGIFINPLFSPEEREKVIDLLRQKIGLSDGTVKFLRFLLEEKAISGLSEIIKKITVMYLDKKRKAKATVITPVSLDSRYDERLRASLRNLTGREVDIDYVVDPALLGGVVIKVGSTMYDSSIRAQLRILKDNLIKGNQQNGVSW